MDSGEFQKYSESISNRSCTLDPYRSFIVERLNLFQDTPAAQMHDWLKESYPFFPDSIFQNSIQLRDEDPTGI